MKTQNSITGINTKITELADIIQKARTDLVLDNENLHLSTDETRKIILVCLLYLNANRDACVLSSIRLKDVLEYFNAIDGHFFDLFASGCAETLELSGALTALSRICQYPEQRAFINYALEALEYDVDTYFDVKKTRGTRSHNSKKKKLGIYYTPVDVARFIVSKCIASVLTKVTMPTILDCSCGSGVFLLQSLLYLESTYNPNHELDVSLDILCRCIWGIDISPAAVDCCKAVLLQYYLDSYQNAAAQLGKIWDILSASIFTGNAVRLQDVFAKNHMLPSYFNCVVGNPPYVTDGKMSNQFIVFVDNMMRYSSHFSCSALILPLSVCYSQGREFVRLRERIQSDGASWVFMNFDRSPDSLFGDQVKTRNSILFRRDIDTSGCIYTTTLQRWTSSNRANLFTAYTLCDLSGIPISNCVPKLSNSIEKKSYDHIHLGSSCLNALFTCNRSDYPLVINGTAYNWLFAYDHFPPSTDENGNPYISNSAKLYHLPDKQSRDFCIAVLSNRLAYWYWTVIGDGFHLNVSFLSAFKVGKNTFTEPQYAELCRLGGIYSEQLKKYPTVSYNAGKRIVNYSFEKVMDIAQKIEKILFDALDLEVDFALYLEQWYSKQVHCCRDNEKR